MEWLLEQEAKLHIKLSAVLQEEIRTMYNKNLNNHHNKNNLKLINKNVKMNHNPFHNVYKDNLMI